MGRAMAGEVRKPPTAVFCFAYPVGLMFVALIPRSGSLGEVVLSVAVLRAMVSGVCDTTNRSTWLQLSLLEVAQE
jgi:uncharacterized membrane protein